MGTSLERIFFNAGPVLKMEILLEIGRFPGLTPRNVNPYRIKLMYCMNCLSKTVTQDTNRFGPDATRRGV